jgi:hypothetical protein
MEKKIESLLDPVKNKGGIAETERRMIKAEKWAGELEEKLSFTVEKFEE